MGVKTTNNGDDGRRVAIQSSPHVVAIGRLRLLH
jgi:hypothetical protein